MYPGSCFGYYSLLLIYGTTLLPKSLKSMPDLSQVTIDNERFFVIKDIDQLRPFFMNIVSESDHWMFVSSNGGLTAGRRNSEFSLFPYYTDDKITESVEVTGSKSVFRVQVGLLFAKMALSACVAVSSG